MYYMRVTLRHILKHVKMGYMKKNYGAEKQQVVCKIPTKLNEQLRKIAVDHRTTKTYVIISALKHCFNDSSESYLCENY